MLVGLLEGKRPVDERNAFMVGREGCMVVVDWPFLHFRGAKEGI